MNWQTHLSNYKRCLKNISGSKYPLQSLKRLLSTSVELFLVFWSKNLCLWHSEFVSVLLMMLWHFSNLIRRPPGPLSACWIWLCALMRCVKCVVKSAPHMWERKRVGVNFPAVLSQMDAAAYVRRTRPPALRIWACLRTEFLQNTAKLSRFTCLTRLSSSRRQTSLYFFLWVSNGLQPDVSESRWRPDKRFVFVCSRSRLVYKAPGVNKRQNMFGKARGADL